MARYKGNGMAPKGFRGRDIRRPQRVPLSDWLMPLKLFHTEHTTFQLQHTSASLASRLLCNLVTELGEYPLQRKVCLDGAHLRMRESVYW